MAKYILGLERAAGARPLSVKGDLAWSQILYLKTHIETGKKAKSTKVLQ